MGNCLSDPSSDAKPKSSLAGAQRLGSPPTSPKPVSAPPKSNIHTLASSASPPQQASIARKHNLTGGQNTLGDGFEDPVRVKGEGGGGAREARLRAAEERAAKSSTRGVSSANPKAGVLSAKLKEHNKAVDANLVNPKAGQDSLARPGDWN